MKKTKKGVRRPIAFEDTALTQWFERDRAHVALVDTKNDDETIVEWWDSDVAEAFEDGFLDPRDPHASAYDYAVEVGLILSGTGRSHR